jgi:signal peptidase II
MKFSLFLSLPLYGLDQLTKRLVLQFINPFDARIVIPDFFTLVNVTNNGAAFGTFKGNNTFFIGISLLALVVVTVLLVRSHPADLWRDISLALLLAGILGNLTDRLLYGHVIDFLLFNLHVRYADPWPAFNVADSCISIAVVLFIIHSFRGQKAAPGG